MSTILIFGGTSGIGESLARRFHVAGKTVIVTGRRQDRLDALAQELPGLMTYVLDNTDLPSLPFHLESLKSKLPDVDTVWVNSGISYTADFKNLESQVTTESSIKSTSIPRHR